MIKTRPADARGRTQLAWLDSRHTFSFGQYRDPQFMGFRCLRVINDDHAAPCGGFPSHSHANMEIISYVLKGALAHRDSTGGTGELHPGDAQVMTAGRGIEHSEYNGSDKELVHFLQVWIEPSRRDVTPNYADRAFDVANHPNRWHTIASPDGREDSLVICQDARVNVALLEPGERLEHTLAPDRAAWLHVATGAVHINGYGLKAGDGASIEEVTLLEITGDEAGELLLFDLP